MSGRGELGESGRRRGEVFGVVVRRWETRRSGGVTETEIGAGIQNSKTATATSAVKWRSVILVELGLADARVIFCSFLWREGAHQGTPSVETKRGVTD